jgi:hypothetical protein
MRSERKDAGSTTRSERSDAGSTTRSTCSEWEHDAQRARDAGR